MQAVDVNFKGGIGFQVQARQHVLTVDLAKEKGGQDEGMTPPEIFIASLGTCIGVYVARYCQNAKLDVEGMSIHLEWQLSDDKTRISVIDAVISLPKADVGRREKAVLEAAHHCLIHNTITNQPQINLSLV